MVSFLLHKVYEAGMCLEEGSGVALVPNEYLIGHQGCP